MDTKLGFRKELFRNTLNLEVPLEVRLRLSKNIFSGKKAFIFAAGPSLSLVDIQKLSPLLNENLVICIKQSVNVIQNMSDLLLMNFCNFSGYNWSEIRSPVIWTSFDKGHNEIIKERQLKCNALLPVIENAKNNLEGLSTSTAGKECWGNFQRLLDGKAVWGPGLMYELAIPFALHSGVEHICLVGWDIGTLSKHEEKAFLNEHFYKNDNVEMKTKITNQEIDIVAKSTGSLKRWLAEQGIDLSIISDRSLVDSSIRREDQWLKKEV
ncbi:MAG: hypothetical protein AB9Q22_01045 [Candidatus Reddybacter sp.]